jgi:uncharacterized protein YbjT (DUF2867 family)
MGTTTTVLVTGATGTIGSRLIPELQAAGVSVRALVRNAAKAAALQAQGVRTVLGDLDQPETLDAALVGVDKVFLLTWNGPTAPQQARNIIQAAQRAGRPHIVRISAHGTEASRIIRDHLTVEEELKVSSLPSPVENFTTAFQLAGNSCTLQIDWETTRASATFSRSK